MAAAQRVLAPESSLGAQNSAKFPVKFPDSREFVWRRVRSALRRQPASPGLRENAPDSSRKARQQRAFAIRGPVSVLSISRHAGRIRESLWLTPRIFPFLGDSGRRLGSIMHCVARHSCSPARCASPKGLTTTHHVLGALGKSFLRSRGEAPIRMPGMNELVAA